MPKVSVIIPSYNQAEFVEETLQSVVDQTFTDWEVVVVNDGSTDNTEEVIKNFISRQPDPAKFTYIYQENKGLPATRNVAISNINSDIVMVLDSDDTLLPTCLEEMYAVLEANPDISIVGSNIRHFGEWCEDTTTFDSIYDPRQVSGVENKISPTAMYRKKVWETVGGYDESMIAAPEDWDFWLSCIDHKQTYQKVHKILSTSRVHPKSKSQKDYRNSPDQNRTEVNLVLAKHGLSLRY